VNILKLDKTYDCWCGYCGCRDYFNTLIVSNAGIYFIQCGVCNKYDRVSDTFLEHVKRLISISTDKTNSKCFKGWHVKSSSRWK
jgi:hypothetical protein